MADNGKERLETVALQIEEMECGCEAAFVDRKMSGPHCVWRDSTGH